jgi:hypothetical protein
MAAAPVLIQIGLMWPVDPRKRLKWHLIGVYEALVLYILAAHKAMIIWATLAERCYGQALSQLIRALRRQTLAATDDTLGAPIFLGAFEMICLTGHNSWMLHSRGISYLFRARGARAHIQRLGRTLLVSFRGFLVYDALIHRVRFFLEDKEWGSIIPDMIHEDRRRGKASRLGELIEYAFHEVARCPGFLAMTHAQVKSANLADTEREFLITSISDCQRELLEYHTEGIAAMNSRQQPYSAGISLGQFPVRLILHLESSPYKEWAQPLLYSSNYL